MPTGRIGLPGGPMFVCTPGENIGMEMLCDGNRDCDNGNDETTSLCESKTFYI